MKLLGAVAELTAKVEALEATKAAALDNSTDLAGLKAAIVTALVDIETPSTLPSIPTPTPEPTPTPTPDPDNLIPDDWTTTDKLKST